MNRKQFLSTCGAGLCSCAFFHPSVSRAAEDKPPAPEDWRLPFAQKRYARLLNILSEQTSEATVESVLGLLGGYCASTMDALEKYKGNVDGFMREFSERYNEQITYDREAQVITVVGPERTQCFCPLVNSRTSGIVCACSMGWQQHVYETLLGRKVQVKLVETVQRGGKRCVFEIKVSEEPMEDPAAVAMN